MRERAFIAALGIGQICSWGSLYYSFPLIAEAMGADFGWSKPALYGAATLGLVLSGLVAYPVGSVIDRGYGRQVMTGASLLAGLLLIAWSRVDGLISFYAVLAGIGCLQAATLYEPAFAVVARRVGAGRARGGITAVTLWGGFASTVFVPVVQMLLDRIGWRDTLVVLGIVNMTVCAGLYMAAIRASRDHPSHAAEKREGVIASGRGAVRWALRTRVFWGLAVAFVAYAAAMSAFTFHLYPLLIERGLEAAGVVTVMAVIGPAQVIGRVVLWRIVPHASMQRVGTIVAAAFPVAFVAIAIMPASLAVLAAIAAVYGAANGMMTIVRGAAVPEMLTTASYGAINGALTAPSQLAKALAPVGAAALWSLSQSYDTVLIALIVVAAVVGCGFWTAAAATRRLHRLEQGLRTPPR